MKQSFQIYDRQLFKLSTSELYQKEKDSIALSSLSRPKQENTLHSAYRQTCFPLSLNDFQDDVT